MLYVRLDVLAVYGRTLEARARKPSARSPIDTPGTRATEPMKIARPLNGEEYTCVSTISTYTDKRAFSHVRLCAVE